MTAVSSSIRELVLAKLAALEAELDIRVLMAIESGSRAWGIASPDSDFDVRFIFTHSVERYLSVRQPQDTINLPIDEQLLDLSGWELRKALNLIAKSNASPMEWTQSPIVYRQEEGFVNALSALCEEYFQARSTAHHYLGLTNKTWKTALQAETFSIKKYFYALRPLFAAMWIVKYQQRPPLTFADLRQVLADDSLQKEIDALLAAKVKAQEADLIAPIPALHDFIAEAYEQTLASVPIMVDRSLELAPLDIFFRRWINAKA